MASSSNLSFNDPLYIHPSDTPGMNLINDHLTGVENYGVWSRAMLIALRAKNKITFIDGTNQRPAAGSASLHQWERVNALVLSWILNTVSKDIFGGIVYSTDAHVVWSDLKEQFDKINGSRIFSIHREIGRLSQGNSTISSYYCKLKQLWDEYGSLVTLPSCECATAKKYVEHDQQLKLLQFLLGLNDSYANVRSQILMMIPLPTVGQAFSIISQEEVHRSLTTVEVPASVFYSAQSKNDNYAKKREPLYCDYCNWTGHTRDVCYKLVGYPPTHRLYKPPNKFSTKNPSRDFGKSRKSTVAVNLVEGNGSAVAKSDDLPAPIFTPEQYAEIIKLFGASNLQGSADPVANMTGPHDWEDNGDW